MQYKTRGGSSPQGKPRVYFSCHINDLQRCFSDLTDEILIHHDCAVWYLSDPQVERDEAFFEELALMQLMVMPISADLLETPNHTLEKDFVFARKHGIPILPIMLEGGLDERFNRTCGDLHYLFWHQDDATAISYREKLAQYLFSVLIGDDLAEKIRSAFDAYIFLSYRKKDRKYAQQLMRLIHKNPFCRDIAIWYDEFLTPGENFNDLIWAALEKSDLFVLTVTPNVINEVNYIMTTEYPIARSSNKSILPVEMLPTDRETLSKHYQEIPPCTGIQVDGDLDDFLRDFFRHLSSRKRNTDAQHTFFMGLAYLAGIDVEVDHDMALSLITEAANHGLPEAMEKLISMYTDGIGTQRSQKHALQWCQTLAAYYYEKAFDKTNQLCNPEAAKELFANSHQRLWGNVITQFMVIADERISWLQMQFLTRTAVSQVHGNYSPLFDACTQMKKQRHTVQLLLLEDIIHKTISGTYKPYGHLFCWPMIHRLFEATLVAAQQVLEKYSYTPSQQRIMVTLLRDMLVIAGYDCVEDIVPKEEIPLLIQAAQAEGTDSHRGRLNTLFYFPEAAAVLRNALEPDHIYPQIFSLSYLFDEETELRENQPFSDEYHLWEQIRCEDSIGLTAVDYDTLTPHTLDHRTTPELITGVVCQSADPKTQTFFGLSSMYPNLSLLVLPNVENLASHCFSRVTAKAPHMALCLPSGVRQLTESEISHPTGLRDLAIRSLYLYANHLQQIPANACNSMLLGRVRLPQCLTRLGVGAFYNTNLKSIRIPDRVEEIPEGAFAHCRYLEQVRLPRQLKILSHNKRYVSGADVGAFQSCQSLKEIFIPEGTEAVGHLTFMHCTSLRSVRLPESLHFIGMQAFAYCISLESINLPQKLKNLALLAFKKCQLLHSISIPVGIDTIGDNTFYECENLQHIDLPDTLTSIGQLAFAECRSLKEIRIPDSVTEIRNCAFENCTALAHVHGNPGISIILPGVFKNCHALKEVPFLGSVKKIDGNAFENCRSLQSISVPDSVEYIANYAFQNCTGLVSVTAGKHTLLEKDVFFGCSCTITGGVARQSELIIDGMEEVSDYAYRRNSWLENVVLHSSVRSIGKGAFEACSILRTLTLSPSLERIENWAFARCKALSSVRFPESLTHIGSNAFDSCVALTELELPPNLTTLENGAFTRCTGLTVVRIPLSLTVLGGSADSNPFLNGIFQYCSNLRQVFLHDDMTDLGNGTFSETSIDTIRIPHKVTSVGEYLFCECRQLREVVLPNGLQKIGLRAFEGCNSLKHIHLPESLKELDWGAFRHCTALQKIVIPENVTVTGPWLFEECTALEEVTLPENLSGLKENTFSGCSGLKRIVLPEGMVSIGDRCFYGCTKLEEISLCDTLREISTEAFSHCESLQSVLIPEGITELPDKVFESCLNLQTVSLPSTLTAIGERAFCNCVSLQEIYVPDRVAYIAHKAFDEDTVKKISVPSHLVHAIKGDFGEPIHTEETASRTTLFY